MPTNKELANKLETAINEFTIAQRAMMGKYTTSLDGLDGKVDAATAAAQAALAAANQVLALPTGAGLTTDERNKLNSVATGATVNSSDAALINRSNHTGTQPSSSVTGLDAALSKLAGIALGATANSTDLALKDRANHTGTQPLNSITGLSSALADKQPLLVPGVTLKTVGGQSLIGSGNIVVSGGGASSPDPQTLVFSGTNPIVWNATLGGTAFLTLTGNATLALPTNLTPGSYTLFLLMGAVADRTLTLAPGFAPSSVTLSGAVGARTIMDMRYDGVTMHMVNVYREILTGPPPVVVPSSDAPAAAFLSGVAGAWFDAEPTNRFHASASNGEPLSLYDSMFGRWLDRSGNSNHVVQANDALRGYTHSFNGGAQHSGYMQNGMVSEAGGGATTGFYLAYSARVYGLTGTLFSDVAGANTGIRLQHDGSVANDFIMSVGTGASRTSRSIASGATVNVTMAGPVTIEAWLTGGQLSVRRDGGAVVSVACANIAAGSTGFSIGALNAAGTDAANMEVFQVVYTKNSVPSQATRDAIGAFCAAKAGIAYAVPEVPVTPPVGAPTIALESNTNKFFLQMGNPSDAYWAQDNRWGKGTIVEGTGPDQFEQYMGRSFDVGPKGQVAARIKWRWPNPPGSQEVKGYPAILSGRKPGYYTATGNVPGWELPVRLPDGTISQTIPSGATPGTFFPLQLPLTSLKATCDFDFIGGLPTGKGHLSYDLWLQSLPGQYRGFAQSPITHEIMVPLVHWGGYGAHPVGRNPGWYSHDAVIDGKLWHVYCTQNSAKRLDYNFSGLDGTFGKTGWKMIAFVPDVMPVPQGTVINLGALINYIATRVDSAGQPWALGNEYVVSCEIGVEPEVGAGDLRMYNYKVGPTV